MAGNEQIKAKVNIKDIQLKILTYTLNTELMKGIQERLNNESLKYAMQKCEPEIWTIPKGSLTPTIENLAVGKVDTYDRCFSSFHKNLLVLL